MVSSSVASTTSPSTFLPCRDRAPLPFGSLSSALPFSHFADPYLTHTGSSFPTRAWGPSSARLGPRSRRSKRPRAPGCKRASRCSPVRPRFVDFAFRAVTLAHTSHSLHSASSRYRESPTPSTLPCTTLARSCRSTPSLPSPTRLTGPREDSRTVVEEGEEEEEITDVALLVEDTAEERPLVDHLPLLSVPAHRRSRSSSLTSLSVSLRLPFRRGRLSGLAHELASAIASAELTHSPGRSVTRLHHRQGGSQDQRGSSSLAVPDQDQRARRGSLQWRIAPRASRYHHGSAFWHSGGRQAAVREVGAGEAKTCVSSQLTPRAESPAHPFPSHQHRARRLIRGWLTEAIAPRHAVG